MHTGLTISLGMTGLLIVPFAILLLRGKTLGMFGGLQKDVEATFDKKAVCRFLGAIYVIVALICFLGVALALLELAPLPILYVFNFVPVMSVFSQFYINKSKRFRIIKEGSDAS